MYIVWWRFNKSAYNSIIFASCYPFDIFNQIMYWANTLSQISVARTEQRLLGYVDIFAPEATRMA